MPEADHVDAPILPFISGGSGEEMADKRIELFLIEFMALHGRPHQLKLSHRIGDGGASGSRLFPIPCFSHMILFHFITSTSFQAFYIYIKRH